MSHIEEQLIRDIAAVTGGVVVTDSDLRIAREGLDERITRDQRARRLTVISAAAAAVLLLVLGVAVLQDDGDKRTAPPADQGPTTSAPDVVSLTGSAPTDDLLQGVWRLDNGGVLMRFAPPDLISFDNSGRLFEDPSIQGRYAIEGDQITVTVDGGPAGCGGQELVMRAALPEPGVLHFVFTKPGTGNCGVTPDERWVMEQVLPPGPVFADFALSEDVGATWRPVTEQDLLHGSWFVERSGYVVELAPNNEYHVAGGAGEQVDYGAWELRGSKLVLTSWPDSVQCEASDELVLGGLEAYFSGTTGLRGKVEKNTCGGKWADAAWFLIPDERTR